MVLAYCTLTFTPSLPRASSTPQKERFGFPGVCPYLFSQGSWIVWTGLEWRFSIPPMLPPLASTAKGLGSGGDHIWAEFFPKCLHVYASFLSLA